MLILLFSICVYANPILNALIYQDTESLINHAEVDHPLYWQILANIDPQSSQLYRDLSSHPMDSQLAQAHALFIAKPNIAKLIEKYKNIQNQKTSPQLEAALLLAIAKHGDCTHLPVLRDALTLSHPLRLPIQTEQALYGLGILADQKRCDFSQELNLLLPMLSSFSIDRRKAVAFALSRIKPKWKNPEQLFDIIQREGHPQIRAWLVEAVQNTPASTEQEKQWLADYDQGVRLQAIASRIQSPLLPELLKDEELWVQLETIRALGRRGEDLLRIIEAGATISAEEESIIHRSRTFAHALVAIDASKQLPLENLLTNDRPTEIRARVTAKLTDERQLRILLNDKEPAVRTQAARKLLQENPEDLDLLLSLLEHSKLEAAFAALEAIIQNKEGAIEETLWNQLESNNSLLIRRVLEALSVLDLIKTPAEAEPLLRPIFQDTSLSILLPLHRITYALGLKTEDIEWPEDLDTKRQMQINTNYGPLQFELFVDHAPLTCWQWSTQVLRGDHNQVWVDGDFRYLRIPIEQPVYNVGERNTLPVRKGSLLIDPSQFNAEIFIALEDHPEDLGRFIVFGQLIEGENILRHLRPHERIQKIDIIPTGK